MNYKAGTGVKVVKCHPIDDRSHEGRFGFIENKCCDRPGCVGVRVDNFDVHCCALEVELVTPKRPVGRPKKTMIQKLAKEYVESIHKHIWAKWVWSATVQRRSCTKCGWTQVADIERIQK